MPIATNPQASAIPAGWILLEEWAYIRPGPANASECRATTGSPTSTIASDPTARSADTQPWPPSPAASGTTSRTGTSRGGLRPALTAPISGGEAREFPENSVMRGLTNPRRTRVQCRERMDSEVVRRCDEERGSSATAGRHRAALVARGGPGRRGRAWSGGRGASGSGCAQPLARGPLAEPDLEARPHFPRGSGLRPRLGFRP